MDYAYDLNQEISAKDGYFIEWYDDPLLLDENKEQTEEVHIGENDFYCAINDKKGNCIAVYKMTLHVVCEDEYHTWLDWRTEDDACIVGGDKERTCFHCGKKEIEKIKARGYHNYVDGKCDKCEKEVTPTEYFTFNETTVDRKKGYAISGVKGNLPANVVLPDYYKKKAVLSIQQRAFENKSMTTITIPDSVTSIEDGAFYGCGDLQYNEYYNGCYLGNEKNPYIVFMKAKSKDIAFCVIHNETKKIYASAFYGCSSLTSIIIPDSVTSIGGNAFYGCSRLTSIKLPDSVTWSSDKAFYGCSSLTSIKLPDSITSIGYEAFRDCSNLTSITLPDSVTSIDNSAFNSCSSLTSITIPDSVTSIGSWVFYGCSSLTNVTIPDSVTEIGYEAFYGCSSLTNITVDSKNKKYQSIDGNLYDKEGKTLIQYAVGKTDKMFIVPDCVTWIEYGAFYGCCNLTKIAVASENEYYQSIDGNLYDKEGKTLIQYAVGKMDEMFIIPDGVTWIEDGAFYGCSSLTSITLPDSVMSIEDSMFANFSSLTSIIIPDSVTKIGFSAFAGCSSLTNITIPDSVTKIADNAFAGCSSLTNITIPDSVTSIGYDVFENCSSLTSITCPAFVLSYIPKDNLQIVVITSGDSIRDYAFRNCSSLTSVTINGVKSIGYEAFEDCSSLTSVVIGDSVTLIDGGAFKNCSSLTSVTIGNSVTSIEYHAFYECGFTSIVIPDSVTSIWQEAFRFSNLKTVYYHGTAEDWDKISIESLGSSALTNVTRYYYSESEPTASGNYWHYDENGNVVVW